MAKTPLSNDDVPRHSSPGYTYQNCNPPSHTSRSNRGKKNNRNNGGQNYGRGSRTGPNHFNDGGRGQGQQQWQQWMPWQQWAPWNIPQCPYPSYNWRRPTNAAQTQQGGVLGPRPQQVAYNVNSPSPTDIETALHTLNLAQLDQSWYMDTEATSHMTSSQGNLSSYFKLSKNNNIIVGSGHSIPIYGLGSAHIKPPHPLLS